MSTCSEMKLEGRAENQIHNESNQCEHRLIRFEAVHDVAHVFETAGFTEIIKGS